MQKLLIQLLNKSNQYKIIEKMLKFKKNVLIAVIEKKTYVLMFCFNCIFNKKIYTKTSLFICTYGATYYLKFIIFSKGIHCETV